ncbi:Pyrimidine-specific ribonucleoside hydrolase RihA [Diplonema papillatum]|nr:Pyrimidine-specific ribonucleoside hydrolase RihA [Diplonema papillatum]|eukprot:gene20029-30825_t
MRSLVLLLSLFAVAVCGAVDTPMILIQDADIDDYMCTVLLSSFPGFLGEVVVSADSDSPWNMIGGSKLHSVLRSARGMEGVELTLSRTRMYNPFPYSYRLNANKFANLSEFEGYPSNASWPYPDGEAFLRAALRSHTNVTVVLTTGATPLVTVLRDEPQLAGSISRIYWMAGAMDVAGNLDPTEFPWNNTRAEWNVYTDPFAADELLGLVDNQSGIELYLFPLDIADQTALNPEFYNLLEEAVANTTAGTPENTLRKVILSAYQIVQGSPYYRLWDTVTAGYLHWPELYAAHKTSWWKLSTTNVNMGGFTQCQSPSEPGCHKMQYFYSFASPAAQQQFVENVASF